MRATTAGRKTGIKHDYEASLPCEPDGARAIGLDSTHSLGRLCKACVPGLRLGARRSDGHIRKCLVENCRDRDWYLSQSRSSTRVLDPRRPAPPLCTARALREGSLLPHQHRLLYSLNPIQKEWAAVHGPLPPRLLSPGCSW